MKIGFKLNYMKIAILGYAEQGKSAYDYYAQSDNELTVCDMNPAVALPANVKRQVGENYLKGLDRFDLLLRTPIIHPRQIITANPEAPDILAKVSSVTNEFLKICPTKNIIGITGTKGKGTTSTLIAKLLEASGHRVHLGGNIGTPPFKLLEAGIRPEDWVVLELANFQLIDVKHSPHIGVCLMVVPEHLNWHRDFDEYVEAKQQMFRWQSPDDVAVYFADNENSKKVVSLSPAKKIPYFAPPGAFVSGENIVIDNQNIVAVSDIKLLGRHNLQNVCAAVTVCWQVTKDIQAIRTVLSSFSGLEHRLELVRTLEGVSYYDDSFGTTPETAIVALEAFTQPKVIVLGGSDKQASYDDLAETVKNSNVRAVVLIGATGPTIKATLDKHGYHNYVEGGKTMPEIVNTLRSQVKPGDIALLSTGCASFGLFKDYKDRGEQFKLAVQSLA